MPLIFMELRFSDLCRNERGLTSATPQVTTQTVNANNFDVGYPIIRISTSPTCGRIAVLEGLPLFWGRRPALEVQHIMRGSPDRSVGVSSGKEPSGGASLRHPLLVRSVGEEVLVWSPYW